MTVSQGVHFSIFIIIFGEYYDSCENGMDNPMLSKISINYIIKENAYITQIFLYF